MKVASVLEECHHFASIMLSKFGILGILLTAPWQIHHEDGENITVVM